MPSEPNVSDELRHVLESQAFERTLELNLDNQLTDTIAHLPEDIITEAPWLLCYQAMEQRIAHGNYPAALRYAQSAITQFKRLGNIDGRARALSEEAIARYHLGQFSAALVELAACPLPEHPICRTALLFAAYLNHVGIGTLPEAIQATVQGLQELEAESNLLRRATWRIVLQRNVAPAYHFKGDLGAARQAAEDAVSLVETHQTSEYARNWSIYELGLLEQRAGRLERALTLLRQARALVEESQSREPLWRWIIAAKGHTLRDMGHYEAADACYRLAGWGEGDDGPLVLWLLQGRQMEARMAAEARLVAARASASPFEEANLTLFLALLTLEAEATPAICKALQDSIDYYASIGFHYHRASALLHIAAVDYALGDTPAGDKALTEALGFGAVHGYLNFAWWHPARMRDLLHHAIPMSIEPAYCAELLSVRGLDQHVDTTTPVPLSPAAVAPVESWVPTLTLRCLGSFEVVVDGETLPRSRWQGHPAGAIRMQRLLLHLARHRSPQPISSIARYVWPDSWDRIDLATNFHNTLAGLRRVFEPGLEQGGGSRFVLTTHEGYQLSQSVAVTIDLDQLQEHLRQGHIADAAGNLDTARTAFAHVEQLYAGDFALAKPDPAEAEEYRRMFLEALRWLAADDLGRNVLDSCITRSRRLLREDRWHPLAPALLIEAYLARGDRRAARRQYERYIQDHGAPSPQIAQIARTHRL